MKIIVKEVMLRLLLQLQCLYDNNDDGDDDGDDDGGVKRWDDDDGVGGCADSWELLGLLPTLLEQLPEI